jgi:hypothetical protein
MTVSVPKTSPLRTVRDPDCIILFSRAGNGNADFVNTAHAVSVDAAATRPPAQATSAAPPNGSSCLLAATHRNTPSPRSTHLNRLPAVRLGSTSTAWLHIINTGNGALTWSATTQAPVASRLQRHARRSLYATQSPAPILVGGAVLAHHGGRSLRLVHL